MNDSRVPRFAERLLRVVLPTQVRTALLADLATAANDPARRSPRWWYWRQVLAALWPPTLVGLYRNAGAATFPAETTAPPLGLLGLDLRFAFRRVHRHPMLGIGVVVLLTIGVTSTVTVFSIFSELLAPRIGVPDPRHIYALTLVDSAGQMRRSLRPAWADAVLAASDPSVFASTSRDGVVRFETDPVSVRVGLVSRRYFTLIGVRPMIGRLPSIDGTPRAEALLSYRLWNRAFGGDPTVVGKLVSVNRELYMIAGIAPADFDGLENASIWIPAAAAGARGPRPSLEVYAKASDDAHASMVLGAIGPVLTSALRTDFPSGQLFAAKLRSLTDRTPGGEAAAIGSAARVLAALALLVLVAACANTTNVLATDMIERSPEMAVRSAIGGSRARLIRQLLSEYGLYALLGAVLSAIASMAVMRSMSLWLPIDPESAARFTIRGESMAIACAATGVVIAVAVVLPMRRAMRIVSSLRSGGVGARGIAGRSVTTLVGAQVAQTVVLLVVAVTLTRAESLVRQRSVGFELRHRSAFIYSLPRSAYDSAATIRFADGVVQTLASRGIEATITAPTPIVGFDQISVAGTSGDQHSARRMFVDSGYFDVMGTRLVEGRSPRRGETARGVILTKSLASAISPIGSAVGRTLKAAGDSAAFTVAGVVEDGTYGGIESAPFAFFPISRRSLYAPTIVIHSPNSRRELEIAVNAAVHGLDPDVPVTALGALTTLLDRARLLSVIMNALARTFCLVAVAITLLGLYLHLNRHVVSRVPEIGLRMALGATPVRIASDLVAYCLRMMRSGLGVGMVLSLWATSWLSKVVFGVHRVEPLVLSVATLATLIIALVAAAIPGWRASRVDPATAISSS
jgi:putative ABC transport system permease protein